MKVRLVKCTVDRHLTPGKVYDAALIEGFDSSFKIIDNRGDFHNISVGFGSGYEEWEFVKDPMCHGTGIDKIKPIHSEGDYKKTMAIVMKLADVAQPDTPQMDKLEVLSVLVEAYEKEHHPVEAIKNRVPEQQELYHNTNMVLEHEEDFIKTFGETFVGNQGVNTIDGFWIAGADCMVHYITTGGFLESVSFIPTEDFLRWIEDKV